MADTEPDAWGRRVIARSHAKARAENPTLGPLTAIDYLASVDDHLHNIGFLYAGQQQWRLAPAFDLNPFPDKAPESKTWLSEDSGPITSIAQLLAQAARFELSPGQAQAIVSQVQTALSHWKEVAASAEVGMHPTEMKHFQAAFRDS